MIKPKPLIQKLIRTQENEPSRFYKVRLDRNERTFPFSHKFIKAIKARLVSEWLVTYPEPEIIYRRVCRFLGLPRDMLLFNNGSDQSIKSVFETYIKPRDKILLHRPGYAMFSVYAQMFGAKVKYQDFDACLKFDYDKYIGSIDSSFRMAVLENPNGFTGTAPSKQVLKEFVDRCERKGVIALVDEAYFLFHGISAQGLLDTRKNLIIIRTFSKALGIAGLRAGYALSSKENIQALHKVKPMHEINGFAVLAIDELMKNPKEFLGFIEQTRRSREFLKTGFLRLGFDVSESVANFLAVRLGKYILPADLRSLLKRENILIRRPFRQEHLWEWVRIGTGPIAYMRRLLNLTEKLALKRSKKGVTYAKL